MLEVVLGSRLLRCTSLAESFNVDGDEKPEG
jgi:hypothetical protein